jgi:CTD kinase subunit gamma
MNTRANIMYFIEQFLHLASKDGYENYVRMMQRDIIRVVDAVAPDDGTGSANVKVVRRVWHPGGSFRSCRLAYSRLPS